MIRKIAFFALLILSSCSVSEETEQKSKIQILSEKIAQLIDMLWMKLAEVLGKIVPNILLSFIFFVFLFPISLMAKFFSKKDPLNLKNNSNSAWITVEKHFNADSLKDTW